MVSPTPAAILALLLLPAAAVRAEAPPPAPPLGFLPGEEMSFSIDYLFIPTGMARILVGKPEGAVWPVMCQARTQGLASLIDIREQFVSYWDADAKLPRGTDLFALEMGDRHRDVARFDRDQGKATVRIEHQGTRKVQSYDLPAGTHDVVSAFMSLRQRPLAPGAHYELPVFAGDRTFTLVADVGARERLETPAGRFEAFRIKIQTGFDGKFSTKRDTLLWLSDDPRHVLVRISADVAVGSIVATLTSYKEGAEVAGR
jgi:hypothetical protein